MAGHTKDPEVRAEKLRKFQEEHPLARPPFADPVDPLQPQRDEMRASPNPPTRVCGTISDGYDPDNALLMEGVTPEAFLTWRREPENQEKFLLSLRLGLARFNWERRNNALGVSGRRGQQSALKTVIAKFEKLAPPIKRDIVEDAVIPEDFGPSGDPDDDLDYTELLKVAAFDDANSK